MSDKPKKKWMKKAVGGSKEVAHKPSDGEISHKHKEHGRVKAMYGKKKGKYFNG